MGRVKDLLIEFEDIWMNLERHATSGIEANLVEAVADPGVRDMFVTLEETPEGWRLCPASFFAGVADPIPVSPAFSARLKAYEEAIADESFNEWVEAMEHGIRTGAIVVPAEVH